MQTAPAMAPPPPPPHGCSLPLNCLLCYVSRVFACLPAGNFFRLAFSTFFLCRVPRKGKGSEPKRKPNVRSARRPEISSKVEKPSRKWKRETHRRSCHADIIARSVSLAGSRRGARARARVMNARATGVARRSANIWSPNDTRFPMENVNCRRAAHVIA